MKRLIPILLITIIALSACSKTAKPLYEKGSEEYNFFRLVADSVGVDVYDPDKAVVLVSTSKFDIVSNDLMPSLYAGLSAQKDDWKKMPAQRIKSFTTQTAQGMAESKLIYEAAKKAGYQVADSIVNNELEKIYASRGGKEQFIEFLGKQGFTLDYVKEDIRMQRSNGAYLDSVVFKEAVASDETLQALYDQGEKASVRHILFQTEGKTDEEKAEIKKTAEDVLARAKGGEDFAELAKEFSDDPGSKTKGGLYEDFPHGQMVKPFEDASFTLPIGSISDLVETRFGWHIIKVENRTPYEAPFEEVKAKLAPTLERTQKMEKYQEFVDTAKDEYKYTEHFESLM